MAMKKPKTEGLERLWMSMAAINGTGYMDKSSGEAFASSYVMYKLWKKCDADAELALNNWDEAVTFGEKLCSANVSRKPSDKYQKKFLEFCVNGTNKRKYADTISLFVIE